MHGWVATGVLAAAALFAPGTAWAQDRERDDDEGREPRPRFFLFERRIHPDGGREGMPDMEGVRRRLHQFMEGEGGDHLRAMFDRLHRESHERMGHPGVRPHAGGPGGPRGRWHGEEAPSPSPAPEDYNVPPFARDFVRRERVAGFLRELRSRLNEGLHEAAPDLDRVLEGLEPAQREALERHWAELNEHLERVIGHLEGEGRSSERGARPDARPRPPRVEERRHRDEGRGRGEVPGRDGPRRGARPPRHPHPDGDDVHRPWV
ncbi:MAG: hypothetical protein HY722_10120 [Planctomycetes bacterium]|nr:hypothetical protein [Planctomycetota bacterium]